MKKSRPDDEYSIDGITVSHGCLPMDDIKARVNAATPGPWCITDENGQTIPEGDMSGTGLALWNLSGADAQFIAHARTDILVLLESIRLREGGVLRPQSVVEAARDPGSPMHNEFNWDDSAAAEAYRVEQARNLIRVYVTVINEDKPPVRTYVSIASERRAGGGYYHINDVLTDRERREQLLRDALLHLHALRRRYSELSELAAVFDAMEQVQAQAAPAPKKAARGR